MNPVPVLSRRRLLRCTTLALSGASVLAPLVAAGAPLPPPGRGGPGASLRLRHLHTGETFALAAEARVMEDARIRGRVRHFLRDHYSGAEGEIDPGLLAQLRSLQGLLATDATIEVISGFRSAATNERLRKRGGGGVATRSLHLEGRALDIRFAGMPLTRLHDAALELRAGGVGFYPRSNFVHIDTGRVRRWG